MFQFDVFHLVDFPSLLFSRLEILQRLLDSVAVELVLESVATSLSTFIRFPHVLRNNRYYVMISIWQRIRIWELQLYWKLSLWMTGDWTESDNLEKSLGIPLWILLFEHAAWNPYRGSQNRSNQSFSNGFWG